MQDASRRLSRTRYSFARDAGRRVHPCRSRRTRESLDAVRVRRRPRCSTATADWAAWPRPGCIALPVPEAYGGEGLGLAEVARAAPRDRRSAPAPAGLGDPLLRRAHARRPRHRAQQQAAWLPGVAAGEVLLTPGAPRGRPPAHRAPEPRRTPTARVTGRKIGVTYADRGRRGCWSPPASGDDAGRRARRPAGPGRHAASSRLLGRLTHLHRGARRRPGRAARRGTPRGVLRRALAVAGLASPPPGVLAGARDLTADYVKGREQFGRALAEFQAVAMQMADVYIASRTLDLAADNAAWRVGARASTPADDLAVAAYWVSTEAPQALRTCHHLHGGMGVDVTYPLHHYFSWVTDLAHALDDPARRRAGRGPDHARTSS